MYNEFCSKKLCEACGREGEISFQAYIGILCLSTHSPGDKLVPSNFTDLKGEIGPDLEALTSNKSFRAYGLGECPFCHCDIWAKIHIEKNIYIEAEIVQCPEDQYEWGFQ